MKQIHLPLLSSRKHFLHVVIIGMCLSKESDSDLLRRTLDMGVDEVVLLKLITTMNQTLMD